MPRIALLLLVCLLPLLSGCKSREERELEELEQRLDALEDRVCYLAGVHYLREVLTPDEKSKIHQIVSEEGLRGLRIRHHLMGRYIRNLLRKGNVHGSPIWLDDNWIFILVEALEIKLPKHG